MKNSRRSDRELAKVLDVSQPTVSRTRMKLEKEGIFEYTLIPNLAKLGFEILAFTFGKWDFDRYPDTRVAEMKKFIDDHPEIIYVSTGNGLGYDRMGISIHRTFSDYVKTIQDYRTGWRHYFASFESFVVSLKTDNVLRNLTLKYLSQNMRENTKNVERP
jgi:DNA-binding Lrp family transcriptional regulator